MAANTFVGTIIGFICVCVFTIYCCIISHYKFSIVDTLFYLPIVSLIAAVCVRLTRGITPKTFNPVLKSTSKQFQWLSQQTKVSTCCYAN